MYVIEFKEPNLSVFETVTDEVRPNERNKTTQLILLILSKVKLSIFITQLLLITRKNMRFDNYKNFWITVNKDVQY